MANSFYNLLNMFNQVIFPLISPLKEFHHESYLYFYRVVISTNKVEVLLYLPIFTLLPWIVLQQSTK